MSGGSTVQDQLVGVRREWSLRHAAKLSMLMNGIWRVFFFFGREGRRGGYLIAEVLNTRPTCRGRYMSLVFQPTLHSGFSSQQSPKLPLVLERSGCVSCSDGRGDRGREQWRTYWTRAARSGRAWVGYSHSIFSLVLIPAFTLMGFARERGSSGSFYLC